MSELQHELKKRQPFELLEQEAMLNLVRTVDVLQGDFAALFREHGVSGPQYNVLRILRGAGGDGLPSQEIAGRMISRVPDITRLVDRLERAGLVQRRRIENDRRVVMVQITTRGLKLLEGLDAPIMDLHRAQMRHLSRQELKELNRLLVKARQRPTAG